MNLSRRLRSTTMAVVLPALLLTACGDDPLDEAVADAGADEAPMGGSTADASDGTDPLADEEAGAETDVGDGAEADEADVDGADADDAAGEAEPDASAETGSVTVDGVAYTMDAITRCDPEGALEGFGELDLDLFALGRDDDGNRTSIFIEVGELSGAAWEYVSWDGPEGTWGEPQVSDVTFTGDAVRGTATLVDSLTFEGSLEIAFDLPVPSQETRC